MFPGISDRCEIRRTASTVKKGQSSKSATARDAKDFTKRKRNEHFLHLKHNFLIVKHT